MTFRLFAPIVPLFIGVNPFKLLAPGTDIAETEYLDGLFVVAEYGILNDLLFDEMASGVPRVIVGN